MEMRLTLSVLDFQSRLGKRCPVFSMTQILLAPRTVPPRRYAVAAIAAVALLLGAFAGRELIAQVAGDRGIPPVAATGDIEVHGIKVNVLGRNAQDARDQGWQLAQRLAWEKLGGPKMPDSQIRDMVSAVIIESEQIGPRRYIATLGVVFDRTRAGSIIGTSGPQSRSAPMLLIPVLYEGGTQTVFEVRNPWQRAWAEFQTGGSAIDYVRPSGAGGDSLLLTYGQTGRRSRLWWRNLLDQFGASDALVAIAHLQRQWPGGPVDGTFTARFGPDNRYLESFRLRARNDDAVPQMLNQALLRFDAIYTRALAEGLLKPDPTLQPMAPELDPELAALIDLGRRAEAGDKVTTDAIINGVDGTVAAPVAPAAQAVTFTVQFATPDAAAVDAGISAVRGTAGVRSATTSSIAIGGISVMNVTYVGDLADLAAALRARGFKVVEGRGALSIRR